MRRLFLRWLKTQWTAVPLAFLIVTAVEVWRLEDGTTGDDGCKCSEANNQAAGAPPDGAATVKLPVDQHPSTKRPPKIDQKPTDVGQKPMENVNVAAVEGWGVNSQSINLFTTININIHKFLRFGLSLTLS